MLDFVTNKLMGKILKGLLKENWLKLLVLFLILIATLFLLHVLFSKVVTIIEQLIKAKFKKVDDSEVSQETR